MSLNTKISLWKHQVDAIEESKKHDNYALFFQMGSGKTATAINILRTKCLEEKRLRRTLILAPLVVLENWKREFALHSNIKQSDIVILKGSETKRVNKIIDETINNQTGHLEYPKIFITNYESMQMKKLYTTLKSWQPEILICDESHRLKNPTSKRARTVVELADICKHKYLLTGSPIINTPLDIYNQYRVLDGGQTFGRNYFVFRATYFVDKNMGMPANVYFPKYVPRPELFPELNRKIYAKAMRVLKAECLDLPPFIKKTYEVELGSVQKRMYEEMKEEYLTFVSELEKSNEAPAVVAQLAITKALRLQQIVSGYAKADDGVSYTIKDNPRLKALSDLLESLTIDNKVIVWATFQNNYQQIASVCKDLKIKYVELHGGVKQGDREENLRLFRESPDVKVFIGNQGAAGIGINLVEASYSIFYSRNFSLEHDLQAESRNYRGGSNIHQKITRIDLVSPGTIDEVVMKALASKLDIAETILKSRKSF